jgi:hypothetical protein
VAQKLELMIRAGFKELSAIWETEQSQYWLLCRSGFKLGFTTCSSPAQTSFTVNSD